MHFRIECFMITTIRFRVRIKLTQLVDKTASLTPLTCFSRDYGVYLNWFRVRKTCSRFLRGPNFYMDIVFWTFSMRCCLLIKATWIKCWMKGTSQPWTPGSFWWKHIFSYSPKGIEPAKNIRPSLVQQNFAVSFSLKFASIFVHISGLQLTQLH